MTRCPGQDMRYWTPEDIFDVTCPFCGEEIEFWKDEPVRLCRECGNEVRNPRINLGCAKWCKSAKECLGEIPEGHIAAAPIIEALRARLNGILRDQPEKMEKAEAIHALADTLLAAGNGDPCVIKAGALICGIKDSADRRRIIEAIGIEEGRGKLLIDCLAALDDDRPLDSPEYQVIHDAVAIQAFAESANREDLTGFLTSLLTSAGKRLAQQRFS